MARFYSFSEFLTEGRVPISSAFSSYTVDDMGDGAVDDGQFKINGPNGTFIVNVNPIPDNIDSYRILLQELKSALEENIPSELFQVVAKAQKMPFKFGNIFTTSLSLKNVKGLDMILNDTQRNALKISEVEFLKSDFASIPKPQRDAILSYLRDLAQKAAIVLECMFFHLEKGSKEEFFEGMTYKEILKEYQEVIDQCQEHHNVEYDGPFDSDKMINKVDSPVDYAYWRVDIKDVAEKYTLRATVSPKILSEEEGIGESGLNFSILTVNLEEVGKEFTKFPYKQLEQKIEILLNDKTDKS
jgi:hypothetical protein